MRPARRRPEIPRGLALLGFLVAWTGTAAGQDAPAPPPAPAPAPSPPPPDLEERLRKMEEMNRDLLNKYDDLSRRNDELIKRLDGVPKPSAGDWSTRSAEAPGGADVRNTPPRPESGGGVSRRDDAQIIGNRRLGKLPLAVSYDYDRYGILFASEDDEIRLKVRLMLQADARVYQQGNSTPTSSGFYLPRSRIYFNGQLSKPITYELSFQDAYGTTSILDAYLNFGYDERLQIRFGRFKTPYTYEFYKVPDYNLLSPERSIFNVNFQGNRAVGLMGWGELFQKRVEYAIGTFDGQRNSYFPYTNSLDVLGFVNFTPFIGEAVDSPLRNINVGGSLDHGRENNPLNPAALRTNQQPSTDNASSITGANNGSVPFLAFNSNVRERGIRSLYELHFSYFYRGLSFLGAWDSGVESYATTGNAPVRVPVSGYSAQVAYLLTGETVNDVAIIDPLRPFDLRPGHLGYGAVQAVARYSEVGLGGQVFTAGLADPNQWTNRTRMTDVGVNWYLNKYVKIYFDWEHAMFANPVVYRPGSLQRTSDLFWFRFQFLF